MLFDLKNNKASRRILANMYVHKDLHAMGLYPCAYSFTLNVSGNTLNGLLNQRSQDMAVANNWNVVQYSALLMMFAAASGLQAGELVHVIADAHIYDRHIPVIRKMMESPMYPPPKVTLKEGATDFYKIAVSDFVVEDYRYTDIEDKFEVAV